MTRRSVARPKAPESACSWGAKWCDGTPMLRAFGHKSEAVEWYGDRVIRVRILREADYRRLLRAAAKGKAKTKRKGK